jgi:hypothetical protein
VAIYALGHEAMAAAEEAILGDPNNDDMLALGKLASKDSWTEADDCYYIVLETEIGGIPLHSDDFTSVQTYNSSPGGAIEALVTADGIVSLWVKAFYTTDHSTVRTVELLPQEAADRCLDEKYGLLITNRPYEVTDVRLEYFVQYTDSLHAAVELVPAWSYSIADRAQNGPVDADGMPSQCYFNAVTGEEIL